MTGSVRYNRCLNFGLRLVCHHSSVAQQTLLYALSNKCPSASPCSGAMCDSVSVRGRQWSELLKRMTAGVAFTTCDASTTLQVGECGEVKFVCSLQVDTCRLPHTHYSFLPAFSPHLKMNRTQCAGRLHVTFDRSFTWLVPGWLQGHLICDVIVASITS